MTKWKKIVLLVVLIAVAVFIPLNWYKQNYSMDIAQSFKVTVETPHHQLLIATQGSDFKNALVSQLVAQYEGKPIDIQVIDVTKLPSIKTEDWDAVVVIHTWENWQAQEDAKLFIKQQANHNKIIVLTTSGGGDSKMEGVDAITSASLLDNIAKHANEISFRVDKLFSNTSTQPNAAHDPSTEHSSSKNPYTCEVPPLQETDVTNNNQQNCEKQTWGAAGNVVAYKHLFISEQPDDVTLTIAKEHGVTTVINLREPSEFKWDEAEAAKKAGLSYYNVGVSSNSESFDPDVIRHITSLVQQHSPDKILLHCSSGNHASAWLAIHMVEDHNTEMEAALALARKTGLTHPKVEARVRRYFMEQSP